MVKQLSYPLPGLQKVTKSEAYHRVAVALDIDPLTCQSDWVTVEQIQLRTGIVVGGTGGNGSQYFNGDRGLGKFYTFEKSYTDGNTGALAAIKITGPTTTLHRKQSGFKEKDAKEIASRRCAHCNKKGKAGNAIEVDHKVVRDPKPKGALTLNDGQALCKSCNDLKGKNACGPCKATNKRFDAKKQLNFTHPFLIGTAVYSGAHEGCYGCYWHDIRNFRARISQSFEPFKSVNDLYPKKRCS